MATDATTPIGPTRRNALLVQALPLLCFAAMFPLGNFLGTTAFRFAPNAANLAGLGLMGIAMFAMCKEINALSEARLTWWHYLIPLYGLYWSMVVLRGSVDAAKQKAGKGPARSGILYLFFGIYAAASDLNELAP